MGRIIYEDEVIVQSFKADVFLRLSGVRSLYLAGPAIYDFVPGSRATRGGKNDETLGNKKVLVDTLED